VLLDDTFFRTSGSQTRVKTDNSGVIAGYKQQNEETKEETKHIAVGRITDLYVHFLKGKDVHDPTAVWSVFVKADWYEPVRINEVNELLQVQENKYWDRCGIVDLGQCYSLNCVFWPSDPLGLEKEKREAEQKRIRGRKRKVCGDADYVDVPVLFDVLTHHDDQQVMIDLEKCF
jgi:hypothetical protein